MAGKDGIMVGKASVNIQRSVRLTSDFQPFSSLHRALLGIFFTLAAAAAPFAFVICADGPRTENAERFSLIFRSSPTPTPLHRLRNYPFNLTQKSRTNSSDISSGDEAIFLTSLLQTDQRASFSGATRDQLEGPFLRFNRSYTHIRPARHQGHNHSNAGGK